MPGAIRVLAVVSLLIGLSVSYLDSQNTADRRMHLLHEAPAPIGLQVLNELPGPGPGAETAVSAAAAAPQMAMYSSQLTRKQAVVFPLKVEGSDAIVAYGWINAYAAVIPNAAETEVWRGLIGAPEALNTAAIDVMRQAGLDVGPDPLPIALFDGARAEALNRPVRSPWRAVFYWLSIVGFVASYILRAELSSIDAERSRSAIVRDWKGPTTQVPKSPKAQGRFGVLSEFDDPPEPEKKSLVSRALSRLRRAIGLGRGK